MGPFEGRKTYRNRHEKDAREYASPCQKTAWTDPKFHRRPILTAFQINFFLFSVSTKPAKNYLILAVNHVKVPQYRQKINK